MNPDYARGSMSLKALEIFIWFKTRGRCFYCRRRIISEKMIGFLVPNKINVMVKEHFVPRSAGGADDQSNLVPSCRRCDRNKGAKFPTTCPESLIPARLKNKKRFVPMP